LLTAGQRGVALVTRPELAEAIGLADAAPADCEAELDELGDSTGAVAVEPVTYARSGCCESVAEGTGETPPSPASAEPIAAKIASSTVVKAAQINHARRW
jgi:hypothetical protein